MKYFLVAMAVMLLPLQLLAQVKLSGHITNATQGEALPGATVLLKEASGTATTTDQNGYYEFSNLPAGTTYTVQVTFLGFDAAERQVNLSGSRRLDIRLNPKSVRTSEVVVTATRATEKTGTTYTNVSKEEIAERNFGQDIPYLLDQTPSVVVNSDAGAGVGYTGIRIRGSDITRINVTVNGIPINDAESHGAFFVNMPDLGTSVQDIQVQRGVGTSTNGAAAFGASINMSTLGLNREAYAEALNTYGSYNTWRHSLSFGSGLLNDKFTVDARLSKISSDGYVDRAFSDLKSYYLAAGYHGKTSTLKFVTFSGVEQTYQAWNGVPEEILATNRTYNSLSYDNETDNYQQDHYQLHYSKTFGSNFDFGGALHFTRGKGYYEQYRTNRRLSNYNIAPVIIGDTTISRSDLIQRKWLDNNFYGATYAFNYYSTDRRLVTTLGGGVNKYDGDHFGEVIWAQYASTSGIRHRYYDNNAVKTDFNIYTKATYQLSQKLGLFGDLQYRTIGYSVEGLDDDRRDVTQEADFAFFNPKAGVTYALTDNQTFYTSLAVGNREPVRSDFTDQSDEDRERGIRPQAERMVNLEAGYRLRGATGGVTESTPGTRYTLDANVYYMDYQNQLVLTGQLNDVGNGLRTNIKDSYRAGIELAGALSLNDFVEFRSNLTLSRNKIRNYTETVYIYDEDYNVEGIVENEYEETDISFSPAVISAHSIEVQPVRGLKAALLYKTVSRQYLDNTSSNDRSINGYQVLDLRLRYTVKPQFMREVELALLVNNLLSKKYEANGYTWSEMYAGDPGRYDYNHYYPQATRNFLLSLGLKF
ncbi:TonB-dependent receptor [Pontibacter qinzhouensis]|uniref:TonB-dependent receptor n=1 Tax=Pontibacter qinzhouensis TaxID=2603253 RepID=A0A5C8K3U1_9BACT|nr:TonB-dependent receptor [Pontibacter qinzhouensis]TXK44934.1 TonB-dependent receptor [Pontibacter qinzhouensis]